MVFIPTSSLDALFLYTSNDFRFMGPFGYIGFARQLYRTQFLQELGNQHNVVAAVQASTMQMAAGGLGAAVNHGAFGLALVSFYTNICGNPLFMLISVGLVVAGILGAFMGFMEIIPAAVLAFFGSFFVLCGLVGLLPIFQYQRYSWTGVILSAVIAAILAITVGVTAGFARVAPVAVALVSTTQSART